MIKKIFSVLCALIIGLSLQAQKNYIKSADEALKYGQYFNAIELYKQAYTKAKKPDVKAKILYKTGLAYKSINDLKSAETYLQKSISAKYPDPAVHMVLADVLKAQMKYPEAMAEYETYKKENPSDPRGEMGIKSCQLAQEWKDNPTRYKIENMALINSKESDFCPQYKDAKYKTLVFTSTREGAQGKLDITTGQNHSDLYETTLDKNGKWSTPTPLGVIASPFNEGCACFTKKGDFMLMTRCPEAKGKKLACQLYIVKKQGNSWGEPEKLPFNIDSIAFGHPSLAPDGKTLYFVAKLPDGKGGKDIWKSIWDQKNNTWSKPINLGDMVNTPGDEVYPYIHPAGKTLYFSSNYHLGMGGLDIFKAEADENGNFTKPVENMKYPINSAADDFGIIFEGAKAKRGYFTSNREGGKGSDDIWSFYLPPLIFKMKGTVVSTGGNTGVGKSEGVANVKVRLEGSNGDIQETMTDKTGGYSFTGLKENTSYTVSIETNKNSVSEHYPDGYLASSEKGTFTTVGVNNSKEFVKGFEVKPVEREIRLPRILFDLDKATLRPESKDSLEYLYKLLIDNPTIIIEIQAHTDSRGSDKKNDKLSQDRAQSVVDYLINEKKINPARLQAKGYGKRKLLIKDDVIKAVKTKEEQEALHEKNRRVVFRIISWDFIDPNAPKKEVPKVKPKIEGEENSEEIPDAESN